MDELAQTREEIRQLHNSVWALIRHVATIEAYLSADLGSAVQDKAIDLAGKIEIGMLQEASARMTPPKASD